MDKYIATTRKPCPFHSSSEQAINWSETAELKIAVIEGCIYTKAEKTPCGGSANSVTGGKWSKRRLHHTDNVQNWLSKIGAVQAEFKGGPRV